MPSGRLFSGLLQTERCRRSTKRERAPGRRLILLLLTSRACGGGGGLFQVVNRARRGKAFWCALKLPLPATLMLLPLMLFLPQQLLLLLLLPLLLALPLL